RVAVLTNRGVLLIRAPGFAALDGAAEVGAIAVSEVAPGELRWAVAWEDVLALELRWGRGAVQPDRVVVHRKGRPGGEEAESLAHQFLTFPGTPQATQIALVARRVQRRYHLDPLRAERLWAARRRGLRIDPAALQQAPPSLPCLEFQRLWHTDPQRSPCVSFWRPVAPD
ncbi:hypothetical protein H632_c5627p0, partial [Helicosporidium sp. ATCC 50920]